MFTRLIPLSAIALILLAGCEETPSETAKDVSEAREDAAEDINASREDAMIKAAHAAFDVAEAEAQGSSKVATERCGALAGAEKDSCISSAEMAFNAALSDAAAIRDAALLAAERP